jgi:hypothetical protein
MNGMEGLMNKAGIHKNFVQPYSCHTGSDRKMKGLPGKKCYQTTLKLCWAKARAEQT